MQQASHKVAVLGGGPAAIAAAFELTAPELDGQFEVTVYQLGWRLGGKCASGRNPKHHQRIEEHGLHVWFGFYENSFRLMREAYEELERPPTHPLSTLEEAFKPCDEIVLYDRQGGGWQNFAFEAPRKGLPPGGGEDLKEFWEIAEQMCDWTIARWQAVRPVSGPPARLGRVLPPSVVRAIGKAVGSGWMVRRGEALLRASRLLARAGRRRNRPGARAKARLHAPWWARLFAILLCACRDCLWDHVVAERCEEDPHLRLFFTIFDFFASATAGIVKDGVLDGGWEVINDRELCDWLKAQGAKQVTLGVDPEHRSPALRAIYDVAFGYPGGVIDNADVSAGTAMNDLLRLAFTYRGSILYKMQAGMGDTVLTPFYEVLKRRGVKFEFFHAVTGLGLTANGELIEEIEVVPQVEVPGGEYDPIVDVKELECWPSEPLWEQLAEGKALEERGVDFENELNPLARAPETLHVGADFDSVVLGIPVGALSQLCAEIAQRHLPFARMLRSAVTVPTQAFQVWLTRTTPELGWNRGTNSVVGSYVEPLDTWCDMSHLIEREEWPPGEVNGIAYFCGVLDERRGETRVAATARAKANAEAFLEGDIEPIWPDAVSKATGKFDWRLLVDASRGRGPGRFAAQFWRANTSPSERYVLTPAGTVGARLAADESGVQNLVLAGDWTRNGIDGGCVEAAMTSGMQAARALIGHERRFTGEDPDWLTPRSRRRPRKSDAPAARPRRSARFVRRSPRQRVRA